MNCRFCGNFVPEGRDSCPVCGRRPEEEPIGKLLSENQPGAVQKVEEETAASSNSGKKPAKGLLLPLIMIALSVLGWMYALLGDSADSFKSMLEGNTVLGAHFESNSNFVGGGASSAGEPQGVALYAAAAAVITLIGVAGVVLLFVRLYNRIKYKD